VDSSSTLRTPLRGLNQARLFAAALVLAVGAVLENLSAFPGAFTFFALASAAAALISLVLVLADPQPRPGRARRFGWMLLTLDVVLVTALVASSGGPRSVFTFVYVLVVLEACFLLSRGAGLVVAGLASLLYMAVVWSGTILPVLQLGEPTESTALEVLTVFLNVGVLLVVAILAGSMAQRYHQAEEHLETQYRHLSDLQVFRDLIFESVGAGLIAVDPRGRITAFNRAAEAITGIGASEALGRPWESIFGTGVDLERVRRAAVAGPGGQSPRYEIELQRRDGRQIPVGATFWLLKSGQGESVGLIGVCQDLSSIKQMEARMRQADRLATLGRLSANIAHEIRNPLASLSGAIEVLAKELPQDAGSGRLVEIVLRESERLNRIIRDFLEYARPAPLALLHVNLAEILDEVLLLLEHRSSAANIKVIREYGDTLPVRADPQQLRQAIWNLCINAVQSMPEGGEVRVGARELAEESPGRLQLWMTDSGQGIAEKDLPHIFEPFYSTKPEGSGIGLALVYRVIQDHGGLVEARSKPGAGTTFTLTLPGSPEAA
jgi:two-component system sensor histidine kinase PilS (NtrC family)